MRRLKALLIASAVLLFAATAFAQESKKSDFPIGSYWDGGFIAQFNADGKLFIYEDDFLKAEAFYKIDGDKILLTDKNPDSACGGVGKYTWKFDGKALSFTRIKDDCAGRTHHLTSRSWPLAK